MRDPRQTKIRRAILTALAVIPQGFLLPQDTLFGDTARLVLPPPSLAEFERELNAAQLARLVAGTAGEDAMKWKLTDAGRLWLDENP